ncbi:MarR family winged helix-turn-helix transcriptional regulator [Mycolicibacterium hodleri]|uniref:MarR family winged helix-turn-helix transcriptional regulator n=1 Tax=Mycolicibacterium hodleri TaxID=49897 RepID=UPI00112B6BEB|nr:MarR family transcriptional regulator [Mycolicibacterium hodleri]
MIGRVGHVMAMAFDREMDKFGIRTLHLGLMSAVRSFGPLSQQRLAEYLGADRATVAALIDDLEAKDLAIRRPVLGDRRARAVSLTDEGLRLHSRADAAAREHERRVFSKLTEAERTQLRTMMLKLRPLPKMFLPPESSDTG